MKKHKFSMGAVDLTRGPILSSVIQYSLPIILMGVLTSLYSSADAVVLGQFAGKLAFSAVGASASIVALIVGALISINVGVSVLTARAFGARDDEMTRKVVGTAFVIGIILGISIFAVGQLLSPWLLRISECPAEVEGQALLYLRILFFGVPAQLLYNMMSPLLSARGDSTRPLVYMAISGLTNVALNVILVAGFSLDVVGVAVATVASQYLSLVMLFVKLSHINEPSRLVLRAIRVDKSIMVSILRLGIPPVISSMSFSLTNFMIQSAVNAFGPDGIAGNSAATNIETYIFTLVNALAAASATAIGQNIGAGDRERIRAMRKVLYVLTFSSVFAVSWLSILLSEPLLSIFIPGEAVAIEYGRSRLLAILSIVSLYGVSAVNGGIMQAFGRSGLQMIITLGCVCGLRVVWMLAVYPYFPTKEMLYIAYPVGYVLLFIISSIAVHLIIKNSDILKVLKNKNNIEESKK